MNTSVEIAKGLERMFTAEGVLPRPVIAYAPELESANINVPTIYIAPGDVTTQKIARDGTRLLERVIDVAVVQGCQPTDSVTVEQLLARCEQIAELLASHPPISEEGDQLASLPVQIDHTPLYSPERLSTGVFVGVITARYTVV
jgi:hypothetical protein